MERNRNILSQTDKNEPLKLLLSLPGVQGSRTVTSWGVDVKFLHVWSYESFLFSIIQRNRNISHYMLECSFQAFIGFPLNENVYPKVQVHTQLKKSVPR